MFNSLFLTSAGGGEHSVLVPELAEVVWSGIIIAILFIAVMKFLYPKYTEIMDERTKTIASGIELAETAKQQLEKAEEEAEAKVTAAVAEAGKIRAEAQALAKDVVNKAKAEAQIEAERIIANANRQIEANRQAAQISLRAEVGILATELAEKIVGEQLKDKELSARVVDRFLDELEAEPNKESVSN